MGNTGHNGQHSADYGVTVHNIANFQRQQHERNIHDGHPGLLRWDIPRVRNSDGGGYSIGRRAILLTIPLRKSHDSGTYIFQGGMAGYGLEATAYTQTGTQTLRYLFDVMGSTGANTDTGAAMAAGRTSPRFTKRADLSVLQYRGGFVYVRAPR